MDGDTGEPIETARIVHIGDSSANGSDLLAGALDDEERSDRDEAVEFLKAELADGPVPAKQVQAAAKDSGIGPGSTKRAKRTLKVRSAKPGRDGRWMWELPEGDGSKGTDATSEKPSPSSPSAFPCGF